MVVDTNAPDILHQDGPDFGWLDDACKVKGDQLTVPGDEELEFEKESEDELLLSDPNIKGKRRVSWSDFEEGSTEDSIQYSLHLQENWAPGPPQFSSDWNLGLETLGGSSSGITRKRRHGSRQVGGSKIVKVKMPAGAGTRKLTGGPLAIDSQGHIKGAVALGSRQKLNSKN